VYGPGHNGFFTSPDGTESWIVYHANNSASQGCGTTRTARAQRITWNANGTPSLGTPVALGSTLDGPAGETAANQRWRIEDLGNDTNRVVSVGSGKVLDVSNCGGADGANIQQWSWLNNNCQKFRLVISGAGGWVRLEIVSSGKVADVANCGTADGSDVRQWAWLSNNCQQWQLQPA
jgi:putative hemolysin